MPRAKKRAPSPESAPPAKKSKKAPSCEATKPTEPKIIEKRDRGRTTEYLLRDSDGTESWTVRVPAALIDAFEAGDLEKMQAEGIVSVEEHERLPGGTFRLLLKTKAGSTFWSASTKGL